MYHTDHVFSTPALHLAATPDLPRLLMLCSQCILVPIDLRRYPIRPRNLSLRIDIHLTKCDASRLALRGCQVLENRGYDFAGPAPRGVEVDDGVCRAGGDGAEVLGGGDGDDFGGHGG